MRLGLAPVVLAFCCAGACGRGQVAPGAPAAQPSGAPNPANTPSAQASAAESARPALGNDCAPEFSPGSSASERLSELARSCTAGMLPLLPEPARASLVAGAESTARFAVNDPSRCVRVLAAGSGGLRSIELELTNDARRSLGRDARQAPYALIAEQGVICLGKGDFRVVARAARGQGQIAVQAYQSE